MEHPKITKMSRANVKRSLMLLGLTGSGKTHTARDLHAAGMKVLVISTENKLITLSDLNMDVWTIRPDSFDWPIQPSEFEAVLKNPDGASDLVQVYRMLKNEEHDYDVAFMDSGMELFETMAMFYVNNTLSAAGNVDGKRGYGVFANKSIPVVKAFQSLTDGNIAKRPVHFIVTWGVEYITDVEGNRYLGPIVSGQQLGPRIPYKFDDILYLWRDIDKVSGESVKFAGTAPTNKYFAKVSSPTKVLPPVIQGFNLARFLQVLSGEGGEKK